MSEIIWDGKGLPPVGEKVEVSIRSNIFSLFKEFKELEGKEVEVICHSDSILGNSKIAVFRWVSEGGYRYHGLVQGNFKPIKSERDKAIEKMDDLIESLRFQFSAGDLPTKLSGRLYDAGLRFTENVNAN